MTKKTEKTLLWGAGIAAAVLVFVPQARMVAHLWWSEMVLSRFATGSGKKVLPR